MPITSHVSPKRITIITGHFGSGKSEFAINFAIQKNFDTLVDLDIINPYFRSREASPLLQQKGIEVISSTLENALGSDLPFIDQAAFRPFHTQEHALYDLGGDASGALLLRQFEGWIQEPVDLLLCVNVYREETSNTLGIIKMIHSIESTGGLPVTGLINNSNFLRNTTIDEVLYGQQLIEEVSRQTNLPLLYTGLWDHLHGDDRIHGETIPLALYLRQAWL
jgi:hypothetical protein